MFKYVVNSGGDPDLLYISEIQLQCELAKQAYKHLSRYSDLVTTSSTQPEEGIYSPLDVISYCVSFLSAVAGISKILFPTNSKSKSRGERLRNRFKLPPLPNTEARTVRNSFEHIDERIDSLAERHHECEICFVDIDDGQPNEAIVLKRLNPVTRTIEFLGQSVNVEACYQEIQLIEQAMRV